MRLLPATAILLSLSVPAFSQSTLPSSSAATVSSTSDQNVTAPEDSSADYATLRDHVAKQNKVLADKVAAQKALVRKNEMILRDAQKMDAANKRLDAERKRLDMANAELNKQRKTLESSQKPESTEVASASPSAGN